MSKWNYWNNDMEGSGADYSRSKDTLLFEWLQPSYYFACVLKTLWECCRLWCIFGQSSGFSISRACEQTHFIPKVQSDCYMTLPWELTTCLKCFFWYRFSVKGFHSDDMITEQTFASFVSSLCDVMASKSNQYTFKSVGHFFHFCLT